MENKNKTFVFFLILSLAAGLFGFFHFSGADAGSVIINEILLDGPDGKEFIELYNPTENEIELTGWQLGYYSASRNWDNPYRKKSFPEGSVIGPGEFFLISIKNDDFEESDWDLNYSSYQLNNSSGAVAIFPSDAFSEENAADAVSWGSVDHVKLFPELNPPSDGKSLEKIDFLVESRPENWKEGPIGGTPKEENSEEVAEPEEEEEEEEEEEYSGIKINEILPNPDKGKDEYIEIYNGESFSVDISNWKLKDLSKTSYVFPENTTVDSGKFFVIYKSDFKFALNNSGQEKITLLSDSEEEISSVEYDKATKSFSYSFNGSDWKLTRFQTPGKENKFSSPPSFKIRKIKEGFVGIPIEFKAEMKSKKKNLKYSWDFGDGKKSYLPAPRHTYSEKGRYEVSLTISIQDEETTKSFPIKIKTAPKIDIQITKLLPNPAGKDSGQEWIEIKNNSKQKAVLTGWKIATGWETLTNHLISSDLEILPDESRQLTRQDAFFYLNNNKMKLELRNPNEKTVSSVSYDKEKIEEDEIYENINGNWVWVLPDDSEENVENDKKDPAQEKIEVPVPDPENPIGQIDSDLGKFSQSDDFLQDQIETRAKFLNYNTRINFILE